MFHIAFTDIENGGDSLIVYQDTKNKEDIQLICSYSNYNSLHFVDAYGEYMLYEQDPTATQPINSYSSSVEFAIPTSVFTRIIDSTYKEITTTMSLFIFIALVVTFLVLIFITVEIVRGGRKEASTLKALGYKNMKANSLIVDGNNIVILIANSIIANLIR